VGYSLVDMEVYAAGMAVMVGFLGTLVGTTFD
jgi:xanthosine utilization system XapX-like protein